MEKNEWTRVVFLSEGPPPRALFEIKKKIARFASPTKHHGTRTKI